MYYSSITSKGQTTIPVELRDLLNLHGGDRINYIFQGDHIIIIPANKSVKKLRGLLPKPAKALSIQKIDEIIRDKYDRD
jgi:AbrB family looped-hinge helix DNA binding protein